jgi:hypothetical protein
MVSDISPVFFFNDQPITFREPMKSTNETSSSDPSNNLSVPKESNLLQYSECNLLSALMPRSKSLSSDSLHQRFPSSMTTSSATIPFFSYSLKSLHNSFTLPSLHNRSRTTEQLEAVGNMDLTSISL